MVLELGSLEYGANQKLGLKMEEIGGTKSSRQLQRWTGLGSIFVMYKEKH